MVNSMLRYSPLPDAERSSEKLPEEEGGEKLPDEIPAGKLVMPLLRFLFCSCFIGFCDPNFSLDSKIEGILWGELKRHRVRRRPCGAGK